jgi:hypothetical protein
MTVSDGIIRAGDFIVTETPGRGRPFLSDTFPIREPVRVIWAEHIPQIKSNCTIKRNDRDLIFSDIYIYLRDKIKNLHGRIGHYNDGIVRNPDFEPVNLDKK